MRALLSSLTKLIRRLAGALRPVPVDRAVERYVAFNRAHWRQDWPVENQASVLVSIFAWHPLIHCYAHAGNHLARRYRAHLHAFTFVARRNAQVEKIYESFGAPLVLGLESAAPFQQEAGERAHAIFAALRTKEDVETIAIDGLVIGDLIYDTYLRYLARVTVDLRDPQLCEYIREALLIYFACRAYFARYRPVAVIPDHNVYIHCGILIRVASRAGVPVYLSYYDPEFYLVPTACGAGGFPIRYPWWQYRELFAALPPERQITALAEGRQSLADRLSGKLHQAVLRGHSAYESGGAARLLHPGDRPKILVLLHDFCDAVHVYRNTLFPDFAEWIRFLLTRAVETPYEWYVKPHPNLRDPARAAMNATNDSIVRQLQQEYPAVRFLPPSASNLQLIEEGIRTLFTVYGTAGHEFAYRGVAVVNAGDNPHIAYHFNFHPRTREEFAALIARAGELERPAEPGQIEEYHYMNYYYMREHWGSRIPLVPAPWREPEVGNDSAAFDAFIAGATPEQEAALSAYFAALPTEIRPA